MPRLFLLDPGLQGRIGHHFTYCQAIAAEARRRGYEVTVWAHSAVRPEVIAELPAEPVFRDHPYVRPWPETDGPRDRARRFAWLSARTGQDLATRARGWKDDDAVVVHTASAPFLQGLIEPWLSCSERPRLVAGLQFVHDEAGFAMFGVPLPAYAGEARLYTHTRSQSRLFTERFGAEVLTVPIPLVLSGPFVPPAPRQTPATIIGYFGDNTREDKGFGMLPAIVQSASGPGVEFVVHAARDVDRHGVRAALARLREAADRGRCSLVEGSLDAARYASLLASCDAVIFPYDSGVFRYRESALLGEALALGLAACVPSDSSLSDECAAYGATFEAFDTWSPESISAALRRLLSRADEAVRERPLVARRYSEANTIARYFEALGL